MKGRPIHIELDDQATPFHISAPRKVPIPLLEQLKTELERITKLGVIEKVEEPSEWCHPIVVAMKPSGRIRLCIDLTKLNRATKRELYQLDSTVETLAKLGDECKVMSKLDANSGYWQMKLDEESQQKCCLLYTSPSPRDRG